MIETLLLLALASQRLAFLWLTQGVFQEARNGLAWFGPRMRYFVNCPVCTSVWAGGIIYFFWWASWLGQFLVWALALSMASVVINAVVNVVEAWPARWRAPR